MASTRRVITLLLVIVFSILLIPEVFAFAEDNVAYTVYVDANAKEDGADGTQSHPFKTISQAKDYVRTLDKSSGDIKVEIKDGIYYIDETIVFSKEDSGTANCKIRYVAAKGAAPILFGGEKVTGSWKSEGNGIYSIPYERNEKMRSLYVNGKRCYMASNEIVATGGSGSYSVEKDQFDWAWDSVSAKASVRFLARELNENTKNPDDIELMSQTTWNTTIVCVESLTKDGAYVYANLQMPYGAIAQNLTSSNNYKMAGKNVVSNVYEYLDAEGEFYFDKTEKRIYYFKRANEDLSKATIVVPKVETLIKVEGEDKDNRVENISFEGLRFEYTDWNLFNVGGSYGRATNQGAASLVALIKEQSDGMIFHESIYRGYDVGPGAVMISFAKNIDFINNVICHTGNDGLSIVNDVSNAKISGNIIYDLAGTALLGGHPQHMYIGDKGSAKGLYSDKEKYDVNEEALIENIEISNNYFSDMGLLFMGNPGVMIYAGKDIEFTNNLVQNTPYSGISFGWGWWNMNGDTDSVVPGEATECSSGFIIKKNKFINCITTLADGGAIYTLGAMPNSEISENYIKGIGTEGQKAATHIRGIHSDEGTAYVYGEKNVIDIDEAFSCIDCGDWGRKGNNTWDNNYSRSDKYTTTGTYEPGTVITNKHVDKTGKWDETAQSVIKAAGVSDEMQAKIAKEFEENKEAKKSYTIWIIIGSISGAILIGVAVAITVIKLRKNKAQNPA